MSVVELVADTNVVSYMHNRAPLGLVYEELIGSRRVGLAGCAIAELRAGEAIPGLCVLTAHSEWRVRETDCDVYESGPQFLSERPTQSWHLRAMRSAPTSPRLQ